MLYNDLSTFLSLHFPFKVQKISINAGFTCPNRDGSIGYGGCTSVSYTHLSVRMFVTLQPIGNVRCRLSDVIIRLLPAVSLKVMWLHWLPMEMWLLGGRLRKGMLRLIGYLIRKRDWICNKLLWFFRKQLFIDSGWRCLMIGKNGE